MKILFLDVDGVLNIQGGPFEPACMTQLNRILLKTGAHVVVSSGWRYLISSGQMTLEGFERMLETHGFDGLLFGYTCPDEKIAGRENQIGDWLRKHARFVAANPQLIEGVECWLAIDDLPLDLPPECFLRTDANTGLTEADADRAIELLKPIEGAQ
jgi:hypothetical protein